ncbi:MAG TPA: glycerophosphodiester phosphodiesterase family protein, partial [Methylomirabilota bacterium]|nr:glycerophosphodiester phosphodiesterase family protein [Methylomirabilota bacterium]
MLRTIVTAGLVAGALTVAAGPVWGQANPGVCYAAHRGGSLLWPENSLLAFRNAVTLCADYLEFDVHLSRDGEVVVLHDPTLDRTTTGTGPVRERTLGELRAFRLKDRDGQITGETIPTLDEVAGTAARGKRQMLLEIKVDERHQRYPDIEEKVLAILDRHGMAPATIVMAFEEETWRRIRALRPEVRAGALYDGPMLEKAGATAASVIAEAGKAGVASVGLHEALVDGEA